MTPHERELLDAVLADPDADEPRLRYADWFDSQGDERGEFIRLQIGAGSPDRERDLLDAHVARWLAAFAPWSARDVVFRRGFAEAMSLAGRAFISISDGLFRTTPLRDVRLVAVAPYLDELARTPNLAKLDRLDLSGNWIGPDGLRELLTSPWLGQLRSLSLADNGLTAADVDQLLADPALAGLTDLDVSGNDLGDDMPEKLRKRFGSGPLLR
jgi:uncharacterized protein (TIGR02996 family)